MGQDKTKKVEFSIGDKFYTATSSNLSSSMLLEAAATAADDPNPKAHRRELLQPDGENATLSLSAKFGNARDGVYVYDTPAGQKQGNFSLTVSPAPAP